jgi:hypothetical protein
VGVYVFGNGMIKLLENDINNNKNNGIEMRLHSSIKLLRNNMIHHNGMAGTKQTKTKQ